MTSQTYISRRVRTRPVQRPRGTGFPGVTVVHKETTKRLTALTAEQLERWLSTGSTGRKRR